MPDTLKVLVVGGGDMGGKHAAAYAALDGVTLAAVADPMPDRAARLAAEHGIGGVHADYREAIERERPQVVSVCVPACLHAEVALAALDAGCHVLCEKPIALTLHDADRMISAAGRGPGRLGIVFQRRYMAAWREARRRLPRLGAPLCYHATDFRQVRPKVLMHARGGNGGPVIDCCVHDFDMAMQCFGPVRGVYATGATFARGKAEVASIHDLAIDTASISLTFDGGHTATIAYCWGLPAGFPDRYRYEIVGPDGMVRVWEDAVEQVMAGGRVDRVEGLDPSGHAAQIAEFVRAIRTGAEPPVSPREARAALAVAHAALASIESGGVMSVDINA